MMDAEPTTEAPRATRVGPQLDTLVQQRRPVLQHLDGRVPHHRCRGMLQRRRTIVVARPSPADALVVAHDVRLSGAALAGEEDAQRLFREAMEIWLSELPSIPIVQWYHRIPHNETYWKNWPTAKNPYINSAYWHNTWLLVLLGLEPAQG